MNISTKLIIIFDETKMKFVGGVTRGVTRISKGISIYYYYALIVIVLDIEIILYHEIIDDQNTSIKLHLPHINYLSF